MDMSRQADLHYAYQYGQDAARGNTDEIEAEFATKFAGDAEAQIQFDQGFAAESAKMVGTNLAVFQEQLPQQSIVVDEYHKLPGGELQNGLAEVREHFRTK